MLSMSNNAEAWFSGDYLHLETGVHAHRLDGGVHSLVPGLFVLPSRLFLLVHGRVQLG